MRAYNDLIKKLVDGNISEEEKDILHKWVLSDNKNQKTFTETLKAFESAKIQTFNADDAYKRFMSSISKEKGKTFTLYPYYKYAAILIISLCIGYLMLPNNNETSTKIVNTKTNIKNNDIIIKLADGTTKAITSNDEELKDSNNNIIANKNNNGLSFNNNSENKELAYNEIHVPHGKTFKLELSDGTIVWLNAGTHFKFPQNFQTHSKNRTVHLKGEAYFDVTTNKSKPFIVDTKGINVEVLGTQFNVSSYENETNITTTLVEGAVNVFQVQSPENKLQLSPNFQAQYNKNENNFSKTKVDTRAYTSWINNKLIINNLKFNDILKKLERKHDVVIINKAPVLNNEVYSGEFENETIETTLETIALSTPFKFNINENTIIITE